MYVVNLADDCGLQELLTWGRGDYVPGDLEGSIKGGILLQVLKHLFEKMFRLLSLILYYGFARYLPDLTFLKPRYRVGYNIRRFLCRFIFKKSGENVNIGKYAYFGLGKDLTIGSGSSIGRKSQIIGLGEGGELIIGNNVMMGPEVVIMVTEHTHSRVDIPMRNQGVYSSTVVIEDDVWIGIRTVILKGVRVGKGSIIGAGAVVTKSIPPYSVAGGVPAKVIKTRINPNEIFEKHEITQYGDYNGN